MAPTTPFQRTAFAPVVLVRALVSRPRLVSAILLGLGVAALLALVPNPLRSSTRAIFAWDTGCFWFIGWVLRSMSDADVARIRARADAQDEGKGFILALVLTAAAASIVTIAAELSLAKADHGWIRALRVALAFSTVIVSWFVVQLIFALHYAHEYYTPDPNKPEGFRGGLAFPDDDLPDYWDFLYFAVVIGVAAQTADVTFTRKETRRIGTVHGTVAFTFNTVVLALTINLLAGLF